MRNDVHAYATYKPCSISLIGEVPAHWEVKRLAQIGTFSKGGGGTKDDEVDHGLPCVRYGDIYTSHKYFVTHSRSRINPDRTPEYARMKYGDALFAGSGETIEDIGKSVVNLIEGEAYCGGDVILFHPTVQAQPRFMGYALDSPPATFQKSSMGRGITIMHVYSSQLKNMCIPFPPLEEQAAIVRYLDHADQLISRYISAKERLIALLEEQRQAVIHQAVTRGLDPNVKLKPTNVTGAPQTPSHWQIKRLKSLARIRYGLGQPPRESPTGLPLIRATNVSRGKITEDGMMFVDPTDVPAGRDAILKEHEIIVVRSGAYTADSAIIPKRYRGAVSGYDMVVTASAARPQFIALALLTPYVRDDQLIVSSTRAAQPHLNAEDLGAARILTPPISEQQAIEEYAQQLSDDIDKQVTSTRWQVDLINEYRTRLIADVVTGQLDVRNAAVELPD